jgi:hypothetical protein
MINGRPSPFSSFDVVSIVLAPRLVSPTLGVVSDCSLRLLFAGCGPPYLISSSSRVYLALSYIRLISYAMSPLALASWGSPS